MKKGIALLITIALVAAIAALIGIAGGIVDHSFKRITNKQFLIQSNAMLEGVIDLLGQHTSDINDSMTLDIFLMMPFVFEQKERGLNVDITFTSEAGGLNLNHMLQEDNTSQEKALIIKPAYETYLDHILTVYNVSDKILLQSMIADTVDTDLQERTTGSEIAFENPFFSQGAIYSIEHMEQILEAYKRFTLDFSVDEIPWDQLLSFRSDGVDFNHITPEMLSMLVSGLEPAVVAEMTTDRIETFESFEALGFDSETIKTMNELGVLFFVPQVKAWINIRSDNRHLGLTFSYHLQTKKATQIEITNQN